MSGTFENAALPNADQMKAMADAMAGAGPDDAVVMVNLLKFRDKAQYPDGRDSDLSGREAYAIYAAGVAPLVEKHGGRIIYFGDVSFLQLGRCSPLWDQVALAYYPARKALAEMAMSPEYAEIAVHREAGLEGQLNIETAPGLLPPAG